MPADSSILTVEVKINLLAPAAGERFLARGTVVRPGRSLTVSQLEVLAFQGGEPKACLFGLQTTMCLPSRPGGPG